MSENSVQNTMLTQSFQLVLKNNRNSLLGNLAVAALSFILIFDTSNPLWLTVWFGVFGCLLYIRHHRGQALQQRVEQKGEQLTTEETTAMIRQFMPVVYFTGFMWGLFPWLFHQTDNPLLLTFFAIIIAGLVAGSVSSLAAIPVYIRGFVILTILPLSVLFFSQLQFELIIFGIMMLFYALFTLKSAGQFYRSLQHTIDLNLRNAALIDELTQAKQQAETSSRLKTDFMRNVSHELRTPLNAIVGFTDIMLLSCDKSEQREYLENIRNGGEQLTQLIDDILDFSKIEKNHLSVTAGNYSAEKELRQIVDSFEDSAKERQLLLEVDITSELPDSLYFDAFRWKQVLAKVLSNAIKFSPQQTRIEIALKYDPQHSLLSCEVQDNGIGIAKEQQQQIFEAFTQIDGSSTRQFGGTGLGLSIAKRLLDLMGGGIALQSAPNQGSTFRFWIKAPQKQVP